MMQVTDMDNMQTVGTANDLTMSSELAATIPPPTDFSLLVTTHPGTNGASGAANESSPYPVSSSNSPLRQHRFGLSGESGIEWLGTPSRQPPVTLIRGNSLSQQQQQQASTQQQSQGVHFDLKM